MNTPQTGPRGTRSQTAAQTIAGFMLMHGIDPKQGDEILRWLKEDGFEVVDSLPPSERASPR